MRRALCFMAFSLAATACDPAELPPPVAPPPMPPPASVVASAEPSDVLGARPTLAAPKPFEPPAPQIFKAANGMTVWLVERHTLPIVSASIVITSGAALDPADKAGLADLTADMLDEGAGSRDAVQLSTAINDLGASLNTYAVRDGSGAHLTVLKKNFGAAFQILGDVVARPKLDAKEFKRVSELWRNDVKKRADDPRDVARVVASVAVYGADTPYGHPVDGLLASSKKVDLPAVRTFYKSHWRPDQAALTIVGDLSRAEVDSAITAALGEWKAPSEKAEVAPPPQMKPLARRLVLVDRPDAPQSMLMVVRDGVAASDPQAPLLDLINTALGGGFTSRLNQNLREEHGYTYGARSGFSESRFIGSFTASAAVRTDATGAALKEMLGELDKMAKGGLTDEEFGKVKAQDRAELVQTYETVSAASGRLAGLAQLGLSPTFDAEATRARQAAPLTKLNELASRVSAANSTIIVVGSKKEVLPQLQAIGLDAPEMLDPEGYPAK